MAVTRGAGGNAAEIFVERRFMLVRARGRSFLRLRIHRPIRMKTGEYGCRYELHHGRRLLRESKQIFGVDGLQALLLALQLIDLDLDRVVHDARGRIAPSERRDLHALRLKLRGSAPRRARRRV